jgi:POT family proton-dependent oligopeptide transporter
MTAAAPAQPRTFFGEPPALAYLAFTEAWERFSYYGMTSILVLYMSQALFMPGHVEHIAGFAAFRAGLESAFGPMTTLALASQVMGLYTGLVYFTPVFGGWIADRVLGRRSAVMIGAIMMSAGHIAMAFDASFLLALSLLIVGCGLLKGNISTQVGQLYPESDGEGRTRGFAIFSMAINIGAMVGPLAVGLLAQLYGWHVGFALAGLLMLIGLATYIAGYRRFPEPSVRLTATRPGAALSGREWLIVGVLGVIAALTIFQSIAYYQNANIALVWADQHVDLDLLGFHIPVAWFNSIDPLASILAVPPLFALWRWQAMRGTEPDDLGKMMHGALQACFANVLLAGACLLSPRVSAFWPVLYDIILGVAFLYYWPTLLALVSRAAPARVKATLMGAVFLSLFVSNFLTGWIGGFYERMTPAAFWALHAGIAAVGAFLIFALRAPLKRALHVDAQR